MLLPKGEIVMESKLNIYNRYYRNCSQSQLKLVNYGSGHPRRERIFFSSFTLTLPIVKFSTTSPIFKFSALSPIIKFNTNFKCKRISAVADTVDDQETFSTKAVAKLVAIVGGESTSPLKNAPWEDVMIHTVRRFKLSSQF